MGIIGSVRARFQPEGMARALFATALAQVLVGMVALIAGLGADAPARRRDLLMLNGFFASLWLLSAWLFRRVARGKARAAL